jgi:DNA mismatch repair ATPase MutS
MNIDPTTLDDLSIFHKEVEQSVFFKLNYARTAPGEAWLEYLLKHPFHDLKSIMATQRSLKIIQAHTHQWPEQITNGTIMVLEKLYESQIDTIPDRMDPIGAFFYKMLHGPDFSVIKYTVGHAGEFLSGMLQYASLFETYEDPGIVSSLLVRIRQLLNRDEFKAFQGLGIHSKISAAKALRLGHFLLYRFKAQMQELIEINGQLDAYFSMAISIEKQGLQFPQFLESSKPHVEAMGLWHILLSKPISYNLDLNTSNNFIFLTGANMAGKSTFIKAAGIAIYLAHVGMAVPSQSMTLSVFDGLLSNIQVSDNIVKGESYFFSEVQRIKNTLLTINDGGKWLVLIDELFKGTNVQDAMRCSSAVIKGLLKIRNSLLILSTHLYEIADELKDYDNIAFRYFETEVTDEQLLFSYQLREGVSNDRLGYLIMKREGVVDMIDKL